MSPVPLSKPVRRSRTVRWYLASVAGMLVGMSALAGPHVPATSLRPSGDTATDTALINGSGDSFRLDDRGDALDAHDGQIQHFGNRYYLYGTRYGCGYRWNTKKAPFCGFRSYVSPDLVHWHDAGPLFDADTPMWQARCNGDTYGCYRPHVVYNAHARQYVLWINSYDVSVGYHVFTAKTPTGPFVEQALPKLAINAGLPPGLNHGDHDVFVDRDGTAYLVFTDWRRKGDLVVEQLDRDYLSGSGRYARVGLRATEAPSMFRRGDVYYLTYSDPNCGYCTTGTSYLHASSPLGPWIGRHDASSERARQHRGLPLSKDSCGGQPADVAMLPGRGGPMFLYQSDRWHHGDANEALATHYWEPLRFDAEGRIVPLRCTDSVQVELAVDPGTQGLRTKTTATAPASISAPELRAQHQRAQALVMPHAGHRVEVALPVFQHGSPDQPLMLQLTRTDGSGRPTTVIATRHVPAAHVSWSPRHVSLCANVTVAGNERLAVVAGSSASQGGYGVLLDPSVANGAGAWSRDGDDASWVAEKHAPPIRLRVTDRADDACPGI